MKRISYRFNVKGSENWNQLKAVLSDFDITVVRKITNGKGHYTLFAEFNEDILGNIKNAVESVTIGCFENSVGGCKEQAESERRGDISYSVARSYQLYNMLMDLGIVSDYEIAL